MSTILASITALFSSASWLAPLLSVVASGLGILGTYLWNRYQTNKANQAAANDAMQADMQAHSGDGSKSVGDMQSAQGQVQDLKNQFKQIDSQTPIMASKPGDKK